MGLRHVLFALLVILLLVPLLTASYCTSGGKEGEPRYECFYDVPGGERHIGPGEEILAVSEDVFSDGHLLVVRETAVMQIGAVSYIVQGAAAFQIETRAVFEVTNEGSEMATDIVVEQPVGPESTQSVHVGNLDAGESKVVSIVSMGSQPELDGPIIHYTLPHATLETSDSAIGEKVTVWLRSMSRPLEEEIVEVTSPSGFEFSLKTDASGKVEFTSREVGLYLFDVPHRYISTPAYTYSVQEVEFQGDILLEVEEASPGTAALLFGNFISKTGGIVRLMGPVGIIIGITIVTALFILVGWTYFKKRGLEEEIIVGEMPSELAPYGRKPSDDDYVVATDIDGLVNIVQQNGRIELKAAAERLNVAPETVERWARTLEEGGVLKQEYHLTDLYLVWKENGIVRAPMSEDEKLKMLEATIALTPKQMKEKEWKGIPKAEKKGKVEKGRKKAGRKK